MMNSLGWQTVVATPPRTIQGFNTVWPPVTDVPASSAASLKPCIIRGITLSLLPVSHFITDPKEHQHIVTFRDPHGVEVTEDVGTCYPAHHVRVINNGVNVIRGLNQRKTTPGVEPGDIVLLLQEKKHEVFQRDGNDLPMTYKIGLVEALCGFQFTFKHFDGRQIVVKYPTPPEK